MIRCGMGLAMCSDLQYVGTPTMMTCNQKVNSPHHNELKLCEHIVYLFSGCTIDVRIV
jgi:hypothetical protein